MAQRESSLAISALVKQLIEEIQQGNIADEHHQLPTEPALMTRYNVTRYTLRQALGQLGKMGYIYQAHGIGTFVRPRVEQGAVSIQNVAGLTAELERQGKKVTTQKATITPVIADQAAFQPSGSTLAPDTPMWEIKRQRCLDGVPYQFEHSYYLRDIVGDIPDSVLYGSLFEFIANNESLKLGFQDKVMDARAVTPEIGAFFKLPVGAPMLTMRDDSYLSSGQLFAFSQLNYEYHQGKFFMFTKL
ncbi:GntR family transcriptional regulator [Lacticaseibacillus pabuli]|uniref:GntR family transcriptional regulator n=1 Tax=Lacticaseibacillus pabuli TaxID=3025672 RepID=A0ABY7WUF4_9LACO|nr:GntR family transcriptional regulator [Lacticaseibacillus sp. KACC 23028]WDF82626.1 GntR family transcriptional regulator [Lacticaseibacillus sp. KACC 23028]